MLTALAATLLLVQAAEPNLVVATGTAQKNFAADAQMVQVQVNATADSRETASAQTDDILAKVKAASGTFLKDVATYPPQTIIVTENQGNGGFGGYPGGPAPTPPTAKSFTGRSSTTIRVSLAQTESLVKSVKAIDGTNAVAYAYTLTEEAPARRAVLRAAFLDAKQQAQEVAEAAGLRLGPVAFIDAGRGVVFTGDSGANRMVVGNASIAVRFHLVP